MLGVGGGVPRCVPAEGLPCLAGTRGALARTCGQVRAASPPPAGETQPAVVLTMVGETQNCHNKEKNLQGCASTLAVLSRVAWGPEIVSPGAFDYPSSCLELLSFSAPFISTHFALIVLINIRAHVE